MALVNELMTIMAESEQASDDDEEKESERKQKQVSLLEHLNKNQNILLKHFFEHLEKKDTLMDVPEV